MLNTQEIGNRLWAMADKLRGTMDASEYKNYILPFMFYRYLSENQDKYLQDNYLEEFYTVTDPAEREDYLADITERIGYVILPEYTWEKLVTRIENHQIRTSDYQDIFEAFNSNVKRNPEAEDDFANVFADVNLGDTRLGSGTNERTKALNDIVLMINDFEFKDDSGRDILGDVYEYLIGQFAANAGKKGGEFYTPHEVSVILAKLVTQNADPDGQFQVYDPAMGSGSLLLTVQKELPNGNDFGAVHFYGQELNTTTYNLARMNLMMHSVNYQNMDLRCADTLGVDDWPFTVKDGIEVPQKFDAVVANPPYSQKWEIKSIDREKDARFRSYGVAPASKADYAFVLHGLYHLASHGTMAIVLPHGVLFRGASEGKIRKNLIDNNLLDAVIGLPANLFYGTSIPTCILVFKGSAARGENRDVLFIDASKEFDKDKKQNKLSVAHIEKILETYRRRESVEKYAHVASLAEIQENEYNLNIPRYVDTFEEKTVTPLPEIATELASLQQEIDKNMAELLQMMSQLQGTNPEAQAELDKLRELLQ